ncbi:MAG: monovalent cation/H+ antiporter subunit D [Oleiphilaceae bacterium]|nr:monovalent cation/H+ antiporter subunit D [Oleiphilaceae bacterium]
MSHLPILPILLPLLCAALLILCYATPLAVQRLVSLASVALTLVVALALGAGLDEHPYWLYALGDWMPPFGILLVVDHLSVLMLTLTAVLAGFCTLYACRGHDRQGAHFHALLQFQLAGLNGAFVTGDLFNLFVFFEVLLIASYALLLQGGGAARGRAGLHYVVLNLTGSAIFILALGLLYGMTGTLNMADMAVRIGQAPEADRALINAASMLLLVVFGTKAALLPLLFWLPRAYIAASAPVAALFAIMTKVGIYALLRVFALVFGLQVGLGETQAWQWLWPMALATLAVGIVGVLGASHLRGMTAYMVIVSVGTLLAALSLATHQAVSSALFYLVHSTLMTAAFFLMADLVARQRGEARDHLVVTAAMKNRLTLGILFFVAAMALAGLPPLSGFVSKLWMLQASAGGATESGGSQQGLFWGLLLLSGFVMIIALSRAGSKLFWRQSPERAHNRRADPVRLGVVMAMILASVLLSVMASPLMDFTQATARSLLSPQDYVAAVQSLADGPLGGPPDAP